MAALTLPVTEHSNELTNELDTVDAIGVVRILRSADSQVFSGWRHFPGLFDQQIADAVNASSDLVTEAIRASNSGRKSAIVLLGCGTSGRVAFLCARGCNIALKAAGYAPCFTYMLGGGDDALVLSIEQPEDDPTSCTAALEVLARENDNVVVIGISCGLSAPLVAGALLYTMQRPDKFATIAIGFNPAELSRNAPVEGWDRTCRDVYSQIAVAWKERRDRVVLLAPIVGPEPVAGSSRMKGGSATKALVDSICCSSIARATPSLPLLGSSVPLAPMSVLRSFERTCRCAYAAADKVAAVAERTAAAVRSGGRVVFLGAGAAGAIGVMDASEMVDTYGAPEDQWRSLVAGSWAAMQNSDGDITSHHPLLDIDAANAYRWLRRGDALVVLHIGRESDALVAQAVQTASSVGASVSMLAVSRVGDEQVRTLVPLPEDALVAHAVLTEEVMLSGFDSLGEIALKWMINCVSTGTHILCGAVYTNRMINVTVSNNKLLHRTIAMIALFASVSTESARTALLRAIHSVDGALPEQIASAPESEHINIAVHLRRVLPLAVLLANKPSRTVAEGRAVLDATPVLRNALKESSC
eukprot:TRINITY_DN9008_c0_g1_i1.p1 TRINITY_DN9008_c0_g1~~TRINITY_DN9008_c0_g1_i1.p1  ORF type:complete len:586 (+),score=112.21 TRINITY_DN9008_c0_g1_i1:16-1773(+)